MLGCPGPMIPAIISSELPGRPVSQSTGLALGAVAVARAAVGATNVGATNAEHIARPLGTGA